MYEYVLYTNLGKRKLYADNDIDVMRLALFDCLREEEDFIKVESGIFSKRKTLCICCIDDKNLIQTPLTIPDKEGYLTESK